MKEARSEISHWSEYDYILVNDNFEKVKKNIIKIGFAYNIQKIAKVPTDSHDIKMDVIVTDKFIYRKKD